MPSFTSHDSYQSKYLGKTSFLAFLHREVQITNNKKDLIPRKDFGIAYRKFCHESGGPLAAVVDVVAHLTHLGITGKPVDDGDHFYYVFCGMTWNSNLSPSFGEIKGSESNDIATLLRNSPSDYYGRHSFICFCQSRLIFSNKKENCVKQEELETLYRRYCSQHHLIEASISDITRHLMSVSIQFLQVRQGNEGFSYVFSGLDLVRDQIGKDRIHLQQKHSSDTSALQIRVDFPSVGEGHQNKPHDVKNFLDRAFKPMRWVQGVQLDNLRFLENRLRQVCDQTNFLEKQDKPHNHLHVNDTQGNNRETDFVEKNRCNDSQENNTDNLGFVENIFSNDNQKNITGTGFVENDSCLPSKTNCSTEKSVRTKRLERWVVGVQLDDILKCSSVHSDICIKYKEVRSYCQLRTKTYNQENTHVYKVDKSKHNNSEYVSKQYSGISKERLKEALQKDNNALEAYCNEPFVADDADTELEIHENGSECNEQCSQFCHTERMGDHSDMEEYLDRMGLPKRWVSGVLLTDVTKYPQDQNKSYLQQNGNSIWKLSHSPINYRGIHSFRRFFKEKILITGKRHNLIFFSDLYQAYQAFCSEQSVFQASKKDVGCHLSIIGNIAHVKAVKLGVPKLAYSSLTWKDKDQAERFGYVKFKVILHDCDIK